MIGSVTTHHPLLLCLLSSVTSVLHLCDHVRAWASNPGGMPLTLSAYIWADAVAGDQSVLGFAYLFSRHTLPEYSRGDSNPQTRYFEYRGSPLAYGSFVP